MFTAHWDVIVSSNRLKLSDQKTGKQVERAAQYPFSSARLLVAEGEMLEQEFRELVVQMVGKRRLFLYPHLHVRAAEAQLDPSEREALRKAFLDAGCSKVSFGED